MESTYQTLLLVFYGSCGGISDYDPVVVVTDLCFESSNQSCLLMSSPTTVFELETMNFNRQNREL